MPRTFASGQRLSKASTVLSAMPMTFAAWVNVSSLANSNGFIGISVSSGTAGSGWHMYSDTTGAIWADQISSSGGSGSATTTAKLSTGSWFHVAVVFTSTTSRAAYLSGANKITNATSTSSPTSLTTTLVGSIYEGAFFDCIGSMAFAGIWNVSLSDTDIATLSNSFGPPKVRPDALKSYAPLFSGASPEPDLISSTGYTLTGTPTATAANPKVICPAY
jgi:hypothetical protein